MFLTIVSYIFGLFLLSKYFTVLSCKLSSERTECNEVGVTHRSKLFMQSIIDGQVTAHSIDFISGSSDTASSGMCVLGLSVGDASPPLNLDEFSHLL